MTRRACLALCCAIAATTVVPLIGDGTRPACAEDPVTRAAKRNFEKGEKLFALGRFDEALEQYQKAFDAKPIPAFLFNIGQCYRNLADYEQAIFSFRKYLKLDPDAPNKEAVQDLIDELEAKQSHADARREVKRTRGTGPKPARGDDEVHADAPLYKKWWFWTGVAAVVGGGTAFALTRSAGPPGTDLGNIVFGK
jgi:tetratricopeptide (TPR) repeat protein